MENMSGFQRWLGAFGLGGFLLAQIIFRLVRAGLLHPCLEYTPYCLAVYRVVQLSGDLSGHASRAVRGSFMKDLLNYL